MPQGLEDIKNTLSRITRGDDILDLLMEFERTLDATEIFSYRNWVCGELVKGPEIGRYWFKTSWMYPETLMPDPDGALRLEKIGCIVSFEKDTLMQPRRVLSPRDWKDPKTKEAKIDEISVWIVNIQMPTKYVTERLDAYNEYLEDEVADYHQQIADEIAAKQEISDEASFDDGVEDIDLGAFEEAIRVEGNMLFEADDLPSKRQRTQGPKSVTTRRATDTSVLDRSLDRMFRNVDPADLPAIRTDRLPALGPQDRDMANVDSGEFDDSDVGLGQSEEEPTEPTTMPAQINKGVKAAEDLTPEWYTINQLPGYMQQGIRQVGKTVFGSFTKTPMDKILILANLGGSGPHEQLELNNVAGWAMENSVRRDDLSMKFGEIIPGYEPDAKLYVTAEDTFLLVRDMMGDYIYSWPTSDNVNQYKLGTDKASGELPDLSGE